MHCTCLLSSTHKELENNYMCVVFNLQSWYLPLDLKSLEPGQFKLHDPLYPFSSTQSMMTSNMKRGFGSNVNTVKYVTEECIYGTFNVGMQKEG